VNPITPDDVLDQIRQTRFDMLRGPDIVHDAELAADRAQEAYQTAFDIALMSAQGTIPQKEAAARAASAAEHDAAFVAKAAYNRGKSKLRTLESSLVSLQAELKHMREDGA
jgi:hypothetical protein